MNVIDLSGPITSGMWTYGPPLPDVVIEQVAAIEGVGWSGHRLGVHTLAGTYVESAGHLFADRELISNMPLDRFIVPAVVVQLNEKGPLEAITRDELRAALFADAKGAALLVATGWDRHWNAPDYVARCPFFEPDAVQWVIEQEVSLLGVDTPCIQDPRSDDGSLTRLFFRGERILLAPLVGLRKALDGPFRLIALPLNIPGVCGTPCRAVLVGSSDSAGVVAWS
jgi:arylformamidase